MGREATASFLKTVLTMGSLPPSPRLKWQNCVAQHAGAPRWLGDTCSCSNACGWGSGGEGLYVWLYTRCFPSEPSQVQGGVLPSRTVTQT